MLVTWAPTSTTASSPCDSRSRPSSVAPDRANGRERRQVDPLRVELGREGGLDEGVHHRLVRRDQEDALHPAAALIHLAQRVEVEHGVVGGHRDELLDLERQGVAELLLGEPRKGHLADDHPLVPDAEEDLLGLHARLAPEVAKRVGDELGLADLAGLDRAGRQRHLGGANDHRGVARGHLRDAHGGGPDVDADAGAGHYAPST